MTDAGSPLVPRWLIALALMALLAMMGLAAHNEDWKTVLAMLPAIIFILGGDLVAMLRVVYRNHPPGLPTPPPAPELEK